jgi:hypothetical protein
LDFEDDASPDSEGGGQSDPEADSDDKYA